MHGLYRMMMDADGIIHLFCQCLARISGRGRTRLDPHKRTPCPPCHPATHRISTVQRVRLPITPNVRNRVRSDAGMDFLELFQLSNATRCWLPISSDASSPDHETLWSLHSMSDGSTMPGCAQRQEGAALLECRSSRHGLAHDCRQILAMW